jgi:hypothetical protein
MPELAEARDKDDLSANQAPEHRKNINGNIAAKAHIKRYFNLNIESPLSKQLEARLIAEADQFSSNQNRFHFNICIIRQQRHRAKTN